MKFIQLERCPGKPGGSGAGRCGARGVRAGTSASERASVSMMSEGGTSPASYGWSRWPLPQPLASFGCGGENAPS